MNELFRCTEEVVGKFDKARKSVVGRLYRKYGEVKGSINIGTDGESPFYVSRTRFEKGFERIA